MSELNTVLHDPFQHQYPFAFWNGKSASEGDLLRRAEQVDTPIRQMNKNAHLAAHPVESCIETTPNAWQPQESIQNPDPQHQEQLDASMARSTPTGSQPAAPDVPPTADVPNTLEPVDGRTLLVDEPLVSTTPTPKFTETETALLQRWIPRRFDRPTLFPLLYEIANLHTNGQTPLQATTERLMARSTLDPLEIKTDVFRALKAGWERGLVSRHGEFNKSVGAGSIWTLTDEGKRFVLNGVRSRLKMKEISSLTERQICQLIAVDELNDWDAEVLDRTRQYSSAFQSAMAKQRDRGVKAHSGAARKTTGRTPSKLTPATEAPARAVSREEVVQAIERSALEKARAATDPAMGPIWARLLQ